VRKLVEMSDIVISISRVSIEGGSKKFSAKKKKKLIK
jgi:hypothetical protein